MPYRDIDHLGISTRDIHTDRDMHTVRIGEAVNDVKVITKDLRIYETRSNSDVLGWKDQRTTPADDSKGTSASLTQASRINKTSSSSRTLTLYLSNSIWAPFPEPYPILAFRGSSRVPGR